MDIKNVSDLLLEVRKSITINASPEIVWESMIEQITTGMADGQGRSLGMKIELRPGGRYYRDLGNDSGHFWGNVQVIKPPKLLEICGPLFLSTPATNNVQYRITASGTGSELSILHRGFGIIDAEHKTGVIGGWNQIMEQIKKAAEKR